MQYIPQWSLDATGVTSVCDVLDGICQDSSACIIERLKVETETLFLMEVF